MTVATIHANEHRLRRDGRGDRDATAARASGETSAASAQQHRDDDDRVGDDA